MTRFIDVHVHPPVSAFLDGPFAPFRQQLETHFGRPLPTMTGDELATYYRERDGRAVLLGWDAQTATRRPPFSNVDVAALVGANPDVFLGFGSVDPFKGSAALATVHEAARLGLLGLKLHPPAQGFIPSERRFFPVWEAAQGHGLILLFHTGTTGLGAGVPGGSGIRLGHANPMYLDDVAAEFPRLTIIMAHPSWPWQDEALAVARHKTNVFLELSGWSPRLFAPELVAAVRGPLADRTLFGSDYPFITPDKWLSDWESLDMPESVTRAVLHDNAARLLGLDDSAVSLNGE
ncbi:MAG TPA: amidohydrolase family protein [Acidimicrobiia bacterium]|nr:amidohydrolase family protein [Acidimicrobiia bacterium]